MSVEQKDYVKNLTEGTSGGRSNLPECIRDTQHNLGEINAEVEKVFNDFLKSDAVNNLTSSSTVGKVKEEFTKRAETHLTSNNSYYNIASIKDCIDEILQLNAEKEKEIQQEIARTQYILSEQRRGILQDKSVSEITEKMETGNDYVSQFMIKQNSTYSDDIYANNADLATYKDKRTAFVNNVLSRRDKTNQLITYEYEKLSDAMKRYFKDNPEKREKETKKYEKLFHKVVEDQFKHARKKKTPVDVTRIADIVYHKITGALEIGTSINANYGKTSYNVDITGERTGNQSPEGQKQLRKEAKKAMYNDLIKFLHDIKKPNNKDKNAVKNFVKIVDKLDFEKGYTSDSTEEKVLLDYMHSHLNKLNEYTKNHWKNILKSLHIDPKENLLDDLQRIGQEYAEAYKLGGADVLPAYRTVLDAIRTHGSIEKTYNIYRESIEARKKSDYISVNKGEKKLRKLEQGGNGEAKQISLLAEKLGFPANYAYLLAITKEGFFNNKEVDFILADFNFDNTITYGDRGTSTGIQFMKIYNTIPTEQQPQAIATLLKIAKERNKTLPDGVRLDDDQISEGEIKKGNKAVIMLVQNVIMTPGFDLAYLMKFGDDALVQYEQHHNIETQANDWIRKTYSKQEISNLTEELNKKILEIDTNHKKDKKKPSNALTPEGVQQAISSALVNHYQSGFGAGTRISFDKWVKGLNLNIGATLGDTANGLEPSVGLTLSYNPSVAIGDNTTLSGGVSVGSSTGNFGFIPVLSVGTEIVTTLTDSKRPTSVNIISQKKFSIGGNISLVSGVPAYGVKLGYDINRAAGIEESYQILSEQMKTFSGDIIDAIVTDELLSPNVGRKVLISNLLRRKRPDSGDKEIQKAVNNLLSLLAFYPKDTLIKGGKIDTNMKNIAMDHIAKAYVEARRNTALSENDRKAYFGGLTLKPQLISGTTPIITAGSFFRRHDLNGMSETSQSRLEEMQATNDGVGNYTLEKFSGKTAIDQAILDDINNDLHLAGELKLTLEDGLVKIPRKLIDSGQLTFVLDPQMKKRIKKDNQGDIFLHPKTPLRFLSYYHGQSSQQTLNIGSDKTRHGSFSVSQLMTATEDVQKEWFIEGDIPMDSLPTFDGKIEELDTDSLQAMLHDLRDREENRGDEDLKNLRLTMNGTMIQESNGNTLCDWKTQRLIITKVTHNGQTEFKYSTEARNEGEPFSIEYINVSSSAEHKLMSNEVKDISDKAYNLAHLVTSNALSNISHYNRAGSISAEYKQFAEMVKNKNYGEAISKFATLAPKMDGYIKTYQADQRWDAQRPTFTSLIHEIQGLKDPLHQQQALLSLINVFARVTSVHPDTTEDGKYKLTTYIGQGKTRDVNLNYIMETSGREREIKGQLAKITDPTIKDAYLKLIDATTSYRQQNPNKDNGLDFESTGGITAEPLYSAMGINLGNAINPENPLINPEIIKGSLMDIDTLKEYGLDIDQQAVLKKRAIETLINTPALISPLLNGIFKKALPNGMDFDAAFRNGALNVVEGTGPGATKRAFEIADLASLLFEGSSSKLTLDIGNKNYILTANAVAKFAYFVQCVNHMLLLDDVNISLTPEEEQNAGRATLSGSTVYKRNLGSGISQENVSTRERYGEVSAKVPLPTKKPEKPEKPEDPPPENPGNSDPDDGSNTPPSNEGGSTPHDGSQGDTSPEGGSIPHDGSETPIETPTIIPVDSSDIPESF